MLRRLALVLIFGVFTSGASFAVASALEVPAAPPLDKPIVDQTDALSEAQIDSLSRQINASRQQKSFQLGVLLIDSLDGRPIEEYALQVARGWGIGEKESSNGALLLIAVNDREMRIEVGRGLEGDLTDARSRRIVDNVIAPSFKNNDYHGGIKAGIIEIERAVEGKPETAATTSQEASGGGFGFLSFLVMGVIWLGSILGRSKSWWAGGVIGAGIGLLVALVAGFALWSIVVTAGLVLAGLVLDYMVSKNYREHRSRNESASWWAGGGFGGFGGFGGGGGGGFGGGGFGGGGASGRW